MKVFGGNGRRANNSGDGTEARRADVQGGNNINEDNRGNNNGSAPRRAPRPAPKPKKKGRGWLIALIIIALIVGGVYIWWTLSTKAPDVSGNVPSDPDASPVITQTATREVGRYYTVLVVGIDQLNANTDTIMLVRYDAVEHKANVVSIPRDTLVNVPYPAKKINAVCSYAKADGEDEIEALKDEVEAITGFRPDNYVFINTEVFMQAIDELGGVYFDVPVNMNYDDYADNDDDGVYEYVFTIHVQKGYQLLNGKNALGVFRFRQNNDGTGYGMGDIDRLETQHTLIKAVAKQALQLKNLTNLIQIAQIVIDNAQTDLTIGNMQWYAAEFLKMSTDDINIMTMPGNYSCSIRQGSYVSISVDEWMTMVNTYLNPLKNPIKAEDCNILYQLAPDSGYNPEAANYAVTNGGDVAGGLDSFYSFG